MSSRNKKQNKTPGKSGSKVEIPPALIRAGIRHYESNLQPGDQVKLPMHEFFLLFEDELMARLSTVKED